MRNLNPLICRFYFLDGKAKAMGVSPTSAATDVVRMLAEKIELQNVEGWALYEVYYCISESKSISTYMYIHLTRSIIIMYI